ncbi:MULTISPECIES: hypothetical protein [unclassified Streptomyces]|uniref:hypothetical protein n=1 Tax=unclassified Streptomyces TaxID=2593676 RepID=UPI00225B7B42|nr:MULTISPECIES: hypothetical protein [unclassified Streptomyces]MCX4976494.1 hypothetical protein [Streptomyces sp. NBC_00620]WRZ24363.1 hypothetical protein OHT59_40545 [Streptomyces sp. NBC_00243]
MPAPFKIAEPEDRDWIRIRKTSKAAAGVFGLAMVEAAHLADLVPGGPAAGVALALAAGGLLVKECVYRSR